MDFSYFSMAILSPLSQSRSAVCVFLLWHVLHRLTRFDGWLATVLSSNERQGRIWSTSNFLLLAACDCPHLRQQWPSRTRIASAIRCQPAPLFGSASPLKLICLSPELNRLQHALEQNDRFTRLNAARPLKKFLRHWKQAIRIWFTRLASAHLLEQCRSNTPGLCCTGQNISPQTEHARRVLVLSFRSSYAHFLEHALTSKRIGLPQHLHGTLGSVFFAERDLFRHTTEQNWRALADGLRDA